MIDEKNMDRIVGDYLEINADIVTKEYNSKLPKFLSKFIAKRQRLKLIKILEKFKKSDYVLDWINLVEFFSYIYHNFEPEHKYDIVSNTVLTNNQLEALIEFDNYQCLIYFDQLPSVYSDEDIKFNLKMRNMANNGNTGIDVYISKLKGSTKQVQDMISDLNYVLKNSIAEYIEMTLRRYMED